MPDRNQPVNPAGKIAPAPLVVSHTRGRLGSYVFSFAAVLSLALVACEGVKTWRTESDSAAVATPSTDGQSSGVQAITQVPVVGPGPRVEPTLAERAATAALDHGTRVLAGQPAPVYPKAAWNAGVSGSVQLRVIVEATGQVGDVSLEVSSGRSDMDDAAMNVVKTWRYEPATRGGHAVPDLVSVIVRFRVS